MSVIRLTAGLVVNAIMVNSLTAKKQTTKLSSANFQKMLSISWDTKTRGQTV